MSNDDQRELIVRLANILETCLPYLDRQAALEKRNEAGKGLRSITRQQRATAAHRAVDEAFASLGMER